MKALQVQYHCRIRRMNKHLRSNRAIPLYEMARTLSFIYARFDGNFSADMLKHVGLDKKRQASQKEHVLSLQRLSQLSTRSIFCRLDPIAIASTLRQLSLFRSLLYFQFWFASSNWSTDISMV